MDHRRRWRLLPYLVLRMAGFPFGWLEQLADSRVAGAAAELLRCTLAVDELVDELVEEVRAHPPAVLPGRPGGAGGVAKRLLRAVRGRRPPSVDDAELAAAGLGADLRALCARYCTALADEAAAKDSFERAHEETLQSTGALVLRRFREEPPLRDMLLVTNDEAFDTLIRWIDRHADGKGPKAGFLARDRYKLDTLVRYLQRVCAKNDTHSHFGPFTPGVFDEREDGVGWRVAELERHPVYSRWAAEALLAAVCTQSDRVALMLPRRAPGAVATSGVLHVLDFDYRRRRSDPREVVHARDPAPVSTVDEAVLRQCDGESTVKEILDRLHAAGVRLTEADLVARLDALAEKGAVVPGPELPVGLEDSLASLEDLVARVATSCWREVLNETRLALEELAHGATPARHAAVRALKRSFTRVTGEAPSRNPGLFYGDRSVFYEECLSWCRDLRVGRRVAEVLAADLAPVYDLFLLRPRVRLLGEREIVNAWLVERFGAGSAVGALDYLRAYLSDLDRLAPRYAALEERVAAAGRRADELLLAGAGAAQHTHRLDPRRVAEAVDACCPAVPALCNPDVLLVAPSAEHLRLARFQAIVADLHAVEEVVSHQMFAPFMERRFPDYGQTIVAAYQELIAPDEEIVDVVQMHKNKAFIQAVLPCRDVEAYGLSPKKRGDVLPLGDLVVSSGPAGPRLAAPGSDRFLRLMALPLGQLAVRPNPFGVFGFPRLGGGPALEGAGQDHLPRLEVGRVVLQRETWRVPAESLADPDDRHAFLRAQRLRDRLSLPRHVYARLSNQPKPIYCDLDSPLLVRQLTRMAARADTVELTEMLPGPEDLWLSSGEGRFTAEIRYTAISRGGSPAGEPVG